MNSKGVLVVIVIAGLVVLAGCQAAVPAPTGTPLAGKPLVKIMVSGPQTGDQAAYGEEQIQGVELALSELDADRLKFKYELVFCDDQHDAKLGMVCADLAASDPDVMGVVGIYNSGVFLPASPVYWHKRVPAFPAASDPKITQQGFDNIFRVGAQNLYMAGGVARFAVESLGGKKLALLAPKTVPCKTNYDIWLELLPELGAEFVAVEWFGLGDRDFTAQLTVIKAANPDLVIFDGEYGEEALAAKQMRDLGLEVPIVATDGMMNEKFIEIAGPASEGAYAASLCGDPNQMPSAAHFAEAFSAKYGIKPGVCGVLTYDGFNVLVKAVEKAGVKDREAIMKAVREVTPCEGALGTIEFDEFGDNLNQLIGMYQVQGGEWTYVGLAPMP